MSGIFICFGKSVTATTKGCHAVHGADCVKEIRGSGCHVLRPLEGTDKPYISPSLGLGVSRLFEHEKLARPSDTGHYVVATRLFHQSWAKWDVVPGQRANLSRLAIHGRASLRNGNSTQGTVQLMEGSVEVRDV